MSTTIYTITNEAGKVTSISLEKYVADTLQEHLPNVHFWIQSSYDETVKKHGFLTRRKKGDWVRCLALQEAAKSTLFLENACKFYGL